MLFFAAMLGVTVSFRAVGKRFGSRSVLTSVSGELRPGQVLVVAGPNGAGKSTLLNILAGTLRQSRGSVEHVGEVGPIERSRWFRHLGVAAPDMAMYDELTALENLRFFARVRGVDSSVARIEQALEAVGLARRDFMKPLGTFSSGMKQRVKLAQAVLHRPAVLLLDEPSSNLDAAGHEVVAVLVRSNKAGTAVAVATNDPREVAWGDAQIDLVL